MDDVARRAGVSRATVSRVLAGRVKVSENTRESVLKALHELGYIPNTAAMQLASGASSLVGLLLRAPSNPTYGLLHTLLQQEALNSGLHLITTVPGPTSGSLDESQSLHQLLGLRVAGLFVATGVISSDLLVPFLSTVPVVSVGRVEPHPRIHAVSYDEVRHGHMLADAVFAHGHQQVAVLVTAQSASWAEHTRSTTMVQRLRDLAVTVVEVPASRPGVSGEGNQAIIQLVRDGTVTAAMFPTDLRAWNFMEVAPKAGLRIPDDVSVTGCDGVAPGLTLTGLFTVVVPVTTVARRSIQVMQELLRHGDGERHHELHSGVLNDGWTLSVPAPSPRSPQGPS